MSEGLEGVVAARTVLSHTDSAAGMVWVRGVAIPDLVPLGFEGTVALLWNGFAGDGLTGGTIRARFGAARTAAFERLTPWFAAAAARPPLEALRLALAEQPDASTPEDLVAALTVAVGAIRRAGGGTAPVPPDPDLGTAADLLRMTHGAPADPVAIQALDTYFAVMAESGLSGSSFTARIIASTHASLAASVLGAWCAFTGPRHGGAPGPTLDMLDAAAAVPDDALEDWLVAKLAAGERLMGFGHRVFRGNDPRAEAMRTALQRFGPAAARVAFAARLEQAVGRAIARVKPGRALPPNVEVMAALLLDAVGFPRAAFTPVFAVGRSAGWIAHALEQRAGGRMIRPTSEYVGPPAG
ncbi:MAG: hypothetical protein J0H19_14650 [Rhodospirillales bacterium]|nr:hypothetical protein [Rhodospirillales bacterium]